jgi:hypothetical protein
MPIIADERRKKNDEHGAHQGQPRTDSEAVRQVISMAVGAAETLVMGVGHVAGRAIAEATRAAEGRVPKAGATARARRRRHRAVA